MPGIPAYLNNEQIDDLIDRALQEDVGSGDITSEYTIPESASADGYFLAREAGVLAGVYVAEKVFLRVEPTLTIRWSVQDGGLISPGQTFGTVSGNARAILAAERLALNFLQRMSAIATRTHAFVAAIEGTGSTMLDTRKTVPGLRLLDKWAVRLGGGENHRIGLYDMILIKDNHIAAAGGIREALAAARTGEAQANMKRFIEIEAKTIEQVQEIVDEGSADRILLDNMVSVDASGVVDTTRLARAVNLIGGRIESEASGNVSLATVRAIAKTGVNYISCGALTHSVTALDLSLLFRS